MAKGGKEKRTRGDEAGTGRGPGRPPLPAEERKRRKNAHDKESRAKKKFERGELEAFRDMPGINDMFKAFSEDYRKRNGESLKKNGTNESFDMGTLTGSSNVASNNEGELLSSCTWTAPLTVGAMNPAVLNLTGIGTPSAPSIWGREEELAEVRKGKMPVTGDNCTPPPFPIGGSQSSKFMASANQTAHQSAFAGDSNWEVVQYAPKQHFEREIFEAFVAQPENIDKYKAFKEDYRKRNGDSSKDTYVAKCPSSHGLDQIQLQHQISEMQAQLQCMVDNFDPMVQRSVVALLAPYGFFQQTNAPTVSPAEPHHGSVSMPGGTNAAAGSSGDPTNQSFPHNEEEEEKGIPTEELEKLEKAIEEDLANQNLDKEIQMQILSKDLLVTSDKDMFKDSNEKGGQEFKFNELFNKLEEDLKKDGTLTSLPWEDPQPEMLAGNDLVKQKYCDDYGLPVLVIGEPHHDPAGMQDGNTAAAAGSSGGPATQWKVLSSP